MSKYNEILLISVAKDIVKMAESYDSELDLIENQYDFGSDVIDRLISYGLEFEKGDKL